MIEARLSILLSWAGRSNFVKSDKICCHANKTPFNSCGSHVRFSFLLSVWFFFLFFFYYLFICSHMQAMRIKFKRLSLSFKQKSIKCDQIKYLLVDMLLFCCYCCQCLVLIGFISSKVGKMKQLMTNKMPNDLQFMT